MSVGESRLASAGLMCIAAEANIMSELTHHDDESDKVCLGSYGQQWGWMRRGFCRLVGHSEGEYVDALLHERRRRRYPLHPFRV